MASLAHQVISGKTLSSPATLNRLQEAVQRSVVLSDGWDVMNFADQLQKLAAGNVAFATIPVLDEDGWSDDGMQSVVRVDPDQVKDWVAGLLNDQDQGKTEELAYTPDKTTADVVNDTDINGLAAAVSEAAHRQRLRPGPVGNHEAGRARNSQVLADKADDLGAQSVAKELGGLPVVADPSCRRVRCGWCWPATTPARAPAWKAPTRRWRRPIRRPPSRRVRTSPSPSPIITAGSDDPDCVN